MLRWADLRIKLLAQNKSWFNIDSVDLNEIYDIALSETYSGLAARGVVKLRNEVQYEYTVEYPNVQSNTKPSRVNEVKIKSRDYLSIYPNPACELVNLKYELIKAKGIIYFEIFDMNGRKIYTFSSPNKTGNIKLNELSNLPGGIYHLQAKDYEKILQVSKFIIQN